MFDISDALDDLLEYKDENAITMFTYTFKRYLKGQMIDIVQAEGVSIADAVSTLSDAYKGVFLFVNKIPYQ